MIHKQQKDTTVKITTNHDILNKVLKKTGLPNLLHLATKLNVRPSLILEIDEGKKKFSQKLASAIMLRYADLNLSSRWLLSGNRAQLGLPQISISEHRKTRARKNPVKRVLSVRKNVLPVRSVQPVPVQAVKPIQQPVQLPVAFKEIIQPVALPTKPRVEHTGVELEIPWLSPLLSCQSDLLKSNSKLLSMNQHLLNSIVQLSQK
jgi:hypothetical protein